MARRSDLWSGRDPGQRAFGYGQAESAYIDPSRPFVLRRTDGPAAADPGRPGWCWHERRLIWQILRLRLERASGDAPDFEIGIPMNAGSARAAATEENARNKDNGLRTHFQVGTLTDPFDGSTQCQEQPASGKNTPVFERAFTLRCFGRSRASPVTKFN